MVKPAQLQTIAVIIPCRNEEKGLKKMLSTFDANYYKSKGYKVDLWVIDNNSTDFTSMIAKKYKANVVHEPKVGKGNAALSGLYIVRNRADYIVMIDGDGTYQLDELLRMIEPIENKFCHVVVGSRLAGKMQQSSIPYANRLGNWLFTFLVRKFYLANVTDVLSGYFAFNPKTLKLLLPHLVSEGFAIEMEIIAKCEKLKLHTYSVPITYQCREGYSKLNSMTDGLAILRMFLSTLRWRPNKELKARARLLNFITNI